MYSNTSNWWVAVRPEVVVNRARIFSQLDSLMPMPDVVIRSFRCIMMSDSISLSLRLSGVGWVILLLLLNYWWDFR